MYTPPASSLPTRQPTSWLSVLQLAFSALAAVLLLGAALSIALVNLTDQWMPGSTASDPTQSLMIASSLAFAGLMAVPSAWYALKQITQPGYEPAPKPERRNSTLLLTLLVILLVTGALLLGDRVSTDASLSWFALPILNLLASGLPALWIIYLGTHRLIPGKPSRKWGVFATALILSPFFILVIELLALLAVGVLALFWMMLDPSLSGQLETLAFRLQNSGANPDVLLRILLPILMNPAILILVFAYISVIVPVIEELLKPFAVWLMPRLKITPAQGFGYGVLCGVGFGLFENLGNTSGGGETWVLLASARISTLLLHALNTGLVGWAIASAWGQRRYTRLGVTLLYAFVMHGLWNGLAVLTFLSSIESLTGVAVPAYYSQLGNLSAIGIVTLGAFNLVFFLGFSTTLRRSLPPPAEPVDPLLHPGALD